MLFTLIAIGAMYIFMKFSLNTVIPFLNKHVFSHIWCEESKPAIARETMDRIKELCVDGEVPAETAVMIAASENNTTKEEIIQSFNASDAKELMAIIQGKPQGLLSMLVKKTQNIPKKGMKRR